MTFTPLKSKFDALVTDATGVAANADAINTNGIKRLKSHTPVHHFILGRQPRQSNAIFTVYGGIGTTLHGRYQGTGVS